MKKSLLWIVVLLLSTAMVAVFSLAGCKAKAAAEEEAVAEEEVAAEEEAAPAEEQAKKAVTITFLVNQGWVLEGELDLAEQFEEETGIHVDYQLTPSEQYENVILTKLNAGELPDMFAHQNGKFDIEPQLHVTKNAVDLSNEDWVSRMDPGAIEHDSVDGVGPLYGLTLWDFTPTFVISYNKDIFEQLGLSIPTNYAEFKNVCQTALDAGITPIYQPGGSVWPITLWFLDIGAVYEAATPGLFDALNNNTAVCAGNETMRTLLAQFQEMAQLGFFGEDWLSDEWGGFTEAMASGRCAMNLNNLSAPLAINEAYPDVAMETFGFFVRPLADNQILCQGPQGPTRFINTASPYIDECKEYFSYLAQTEHLQFMLDQETTKLHLCFDGVKDKYSPVVKEFIARYPETGIYMQIQVKYMNPQWIEISNDIISMCLDEMTPDEVLENIDERRAEQAEAAGNPDWQ